MSVGRLRWTWRSTCSTACWSWDARPTSALRDLGRGWAQCGCAPDPCTTLVVALGECGGSHVEVGPARDTLLQGSHGWHPGPDRGSRAALRLTRDARLALQAEPGPTPPHPGAEAQGHELARLRREPAPAW